MGYTEELVFLLQIFSKIFKNFINTYNTSNIDRGAFCWLF